MPIPLLERAAAAGERTALIDRTGSCSYAEILEAARSVATTLVDRHGDLAGRRVAYLASPGREHVALTWGTWAGGGLAVPLPISHPAVELERALETAEPLISIATSAWLDRLSACPSAAPVESFDALRGATAELPAVDPEAAALMIFTSGTTARPKGVVTSHAAVAAQVQVLESAWGWAPDDRILHVLPLHHVHGLQVALNAALWSGACCEFLHPFEAPAVWARLASGEVTIFMAVPTIYRRLIATWEAAAPVERERWSSGARSLRLMTSGSAPLPVSTLDRWEAITGHRLLERYGMTEIGMALSNPLEGERRAGHVGQPLPGVELAIVDDRGVAVDDGEQGEIVVRGPQLFREYWRQPEATRAAFRAGWFLTGDEAVREDGAVRIVGRRSVDIIKTGGYKVSALEIEEALRGHGSIAEVAVVGVADDDWGESVCAAVVLRAGATLDIDQLRAWCREQLAPYKIPRRLRCIDALPCNALGKVTKHRLRDLFVADSARSSAGDGESG